MEILKALLRPIKHFVENRAGRIDLRLAHRRLLRHLPDVEQALDTVRSRWPGAFDDPPDEAPIFLLSAGWRSGSTLLQRLVMSSGDTLIWGEPYADCNYLPLLADSLRAFSPDTPQDVWFIENRLEKFGRKLNEKWIANLYPEMRDLVQAHRSFLQTLCAEPARRYGYTRWGLKEVRYGAGYAAYLRALYPASRLLFLYRNPYDVWRSYRIWRGWYYRWPDQPVFTAGALGRIWRRLTGEFLEHADRLGALLVRFEDLTQAQHSLERLADYLSMSLDRGLLARPVAGRKGERDAIPRAEIRALRREIEPLAERLGYRPS